MNEIVRGPPQVAKSSFTVKDILQLPNNNFSPGVSPGSDGTRHMDAFDKVICEGRSRITSGSSVRSSEYDQDYGHFVNPYFANQFANLDRNVNLAQRSSFACEDSRSRLLAESSGEDYLASEPRFDNIENSVRLLPGGKRVHSVESVAETSASTSPSTLPPSPLISGTNGQVYFPQTHCEKTVIAEQKESDFHPHNLSDVSYPLQPDESTEAARELQQNLVPPRNGHAIESPQDLQNSSG